MTTTANANMWNHRCKHCDNDTGKLISNYKPKDGQEMTLTECVKCHNLTLIRFNPVDDMVTIFKVGE